MLTPLTAAAIFLVVTIDPGGEDVVRELLADLAGLERTVGFRAPDGRAGPASPASVRTPGTGSSTGRARPSCTRSSSCPGAGHHAPSTPGDLLFHIRAAQLDLCFELASLIMDRLAGVVTVVDEVHGFKYFDDRDLLGFVDGTENPTGARRAAAVTVGAEDPDFAGGELRDRAEVPARPRRVERADASRTRSGRSAGASCRTSSCPTPTSRATPTSP